MDALVSTDITTHHSSIFIPSPAASQISPESSSNNGNGHRIRLPHLLEEMQILTLLPPFSEYGTNPDLSTPLSTPPTGS